MNKVYIGLGSNLEDPATQIKTAIADIKSIQSTRVIAASSLYKSPPMGPQDQPDYMNAVLAIETQLNAHGLLDKLQEIEQKHGRVRKRHWGERTLDLDILIYADEVINDDRLQVPHPGLADRAFVVYPLVEITPDLDIPTMGNLKDIKEKCGLSGLQCVESIEI